MSLEIKFGSLLLLLLLLVLFKTGVALFIDLLAQPSLKGKEDGTINSDLFL